MTCDDEIALALVAGFFAVPLTILAALTWALWIEPAICNAWRAWRRAAPPEPPR